ncbi:uncharacterized protein F5891DRAFT_61999 [Suillus fuscotomentosus]|uniref:Uncharacterized protein n=1 Tax=Suillus fuscotomentosus TaxID=1912939 RepID=A0AAD4ECZ6_9AGAM|nr:uncharacterized protein F5891DRAFT_61999 [Suillus fuscotomentosus]KAG1903969.1 hypothetical protein F5891DRAFT_61999 [Suillus fuscotomentosus]
MGSTFWLSAFDFCQLHKCKLPRSNSNAAGWHPRSICKKPMTAPQITRSFRLPMVQTVTCVPSVGRGSASQCIDLLNWLTNGTDHRFSKILNRFQTLAYSADPRYLAAEPSVNSRDAEGGLVPVGDYYERHCSVSTLSPILLLIPECHFRRYRNDGAVLGSLAPAPEHSSLSMATLCSWLNRPRIQLWGRTDTLRNFWTCSKVEVQAEGHCHIQRLVPLALLALLCSVFDPTYKLVLY